MIKHTLVAALCLGAGAAFAGPFAESNFFGRVDLGTLPRPEVVNTQPVLVQAAAGSAAQPIYMHVRPAHIERWSSHCQTYGACGTPVHFVTETWYRQVYLPHVGGANGDEQRYRDLVRPDRDEQRHNHHREAR